MKKSYIVALIFIGLCVIGMIVYHVVSTYGPGSENAQMKKRVEYALEAYGALNDGSSTWSTYTPTEADLACHVSCKNLCRMFDRGDYKRAPYRSLLQN